jgi:alkyl sulfatase BDS1-like metallo-beta-lactamase superfamily hydrolase
MSTSRGHAASAEATAHLDRTVLVEIGSAEITMDEAIDSGRVVVDGAADALRSIFGHLDVFLSMFPIVEP